MNEVVFIVDDSLTVRMDLCEALDEAGFVCVGCADLAEARAALQRQLPGLVVLDRQLPDGDGSAWLAELRAAPGGAECVVLMLSNAAEADDRLRGLARGADEYVGKPYDRLYIVDRARELLRTRRPPVADRSSVLLIDDSETFRQALREALEGAGYRVSLAADGEEGLRTAAAQRPAAIIVDRHMPGLDGAGVIRRLRLDPALRSTPCLLLTGEEGLDAELQALDAGADAFARKQQDVDLILARLAAVLRSAGASTPEQGASLLGPKRILAVDDNAAFMALLASTLRDEGYDVVVARSGEQSLELLAVQPVDCILMDVLMPGMGGLEACRRIKAAPALRDIPVVLLTALDSSESMLAGLEAGADDYVLKTDGELELLKARVRAQLRRKQFEDDARRQHAELHSNAMEAAEARAARELADSRAELLAVLQQKNDALEHLNAELTRASGAKSNFLSTMSHELRTPLNAVIGFASILRDGGSGALTPRQIEFASHIHNAGQHLLSLVNDILDLAKIEAGRVDLELEPVELDPLLDDALVIVRERALATAVSLQLQGVGEGQGLCVDRRRLRQIVYNLLSNAVKFTPKGGSIVLAAQKVDRHAAETAVPGFDSGRRTELPAGEHAAFLQLSVTDSGIGIPAAELDRLFQPFNQVKNALTRKVEGTGLGLATVARLAELHGGCVAVSSEPGVGSCFSCWLPWRELVRDKRAPAPLSAQPPAERPLALVVEDNAQAALLLQTQLGSAGFRVQLAESAEAALALVGQIRPDLITLDVQLPGLDGWGLLSRLKSLPGWAHVPVVVVSVDAGHEIALSLGAAAVLHKPVGRLALIQELELLGFKPTATRKFLVLVVSDAPGELQLVSSYLAQPGFSVLRAVGGREGIELAQRYVPDLIVLDLLMSDVDGIDVVAALRQSPATAGIPVIVVAAAKLSEQDRELLASHLQRPPAPPRAGAAPFLDEVRRALSRTAWGEIDAREDPPPRG